MFSHKRKKMKRVIGKWFGSIGSPSTPPTASSSLIDQNKSSSSTNPIHSSSSSPPTMIKKKDNILLRVFRYYYKLYTPSQEKINSWKALSRKYVIRPVGFLSVGILGPFVLDALYRNVKVEEEAPSLFGKVNKMNGWD